MKPSLVAAILCALMAVIDFNAGRYIWAECFTVLAVINFLYWIE
jgi:hypothetical protein